MLPWATENTVAGHIWPEGHYLSTPGLANYELLSWDLSCHFHI